MPTSDKKPPKKAPAPASQKPKPLGTQKYLPPISDTLAFKPIRHFMTRTPYYANPSTSVRMAMQIMLTHKVSGLPVVDNSDSCLGMYSEMDAILQGAAQSLDSPINYTKPPSTVREDTTFREALIMLVKKRIKRAPIVDRRNKLMGVVSRSDMMRAIFEDNKKV